MQLDGGIILFLVSLIGLLFSNIYWKKKISSLEAKLTEGKINGIIEDAKKEIASKSLSALVDESNKQYGDGTKTNNNISE